MHNGHSQTRYHAYGKAHWNTRTTPTGYVHGVRTSKSTNTAPTPSYGCAW